MKRNKVLTDGGRIFRVLVSEETRALVIDCEKRLLPFWIGRKELESFTETEFVLPEGRLEEMDMEGKRVMHRRFTIIADILPVVGNERKRSEGIRRASEEFRLSRQTVRKYLCEYLAYQDILALAPVKRESRGKELTSDEKNMRWALNKFFYTSDKNSLKTAYTLLLKHKYCEESGKLRERYPSFHQFRYFYRKTRKLQNYYISRDGLKDYQRNHRPCVGNGVQSFAGSIGTAMLDSTVCDLFLVDDSGNVVGRPILTVCVDAYSSLCCGYALSWEGGVYSLRKLILNIVEDKREHCKKFGVMIGEGEWPSRQLPARIITDMGKEYTSETFAQLAETGAVITNLPPYRPELKGSVEKFFDLIQGYFKPYLKGKGLIEADFQERGGHDYRKDACLTMGDFEKILLHCIVFYNSKRILEHFPYTEEMLREGIQPYASNIWNWQTGRGGNLIEIGKEELMLCLLPRTMGKFSRFGLKVNKLRYFHENYTECYLSGKTAEVAYNPEDVSCVWVIENGCYVRFELIEAQYQGKSLSSTEETGKRQNDLVRSLQRDRLQAEIDLAGHIQVIAGQRARQQGRSVDHLRESRQKERAKSHTDIMREVAGK